MVKPVFSRSCKLLILQEDYAVECYLRTARLSDSRCIVDILFEVSGQHGHIDAFARYPALYVYGLMVTVRVLVLLPP